MSDKPDRKPDQDDLLEQAFAAARAEAPRPDAALMARVLDDAARVQAERAPAERGGGAGAGRRLGDLLRAIGGWPALAGLAAAGLAGVWIGIDPPSLLSGAVQAALGGDAGGYAVDLDPAAAFEIAEGDW